MANKNKKQHTKFAALVTFIIATVCLVAGLLLPLTAGNHFTADKMLVMQLPDALGRAIGIDSLSGVGKPFTNRVPLDLFGAYTIDIAALAVVFYALFTLIALILIIPASVSKRSGKTCARCAYFSEVAAAYALLVYTLAVLSVYPDPNVIPLNFAPFIALGGALLMLVIQSFVYREPSSGTMKLVMFILSLIAALALLPVVTIIPSAAKGFTDFAAKVKCVPGTFGAASGLSVLRLAFIPGTYTSFGNVWGLIEYLLYLACAAVVIFNLLCDLGALANETGARKLGFAFFRYALELALIIAALIFTLINESTGSVFGLFAYLILIIAFLQLLINVIRYIYFKVKNSKGEKGKKQGATEEELETTKNIYRDEKEPSRVIPGATSGPIIVNVSTAAPAPVQTAQPAPAAAPAAQPAPAQTAPVQESNLVYTVNPIYNGPTDDFINSLTNEQKIEFAKVFLERKVGNLPNVPYYNVGGDNKKFFSSVFIYFGRVRDLVSDGLMNKLYEEVNK